MTARALIDRPYSGSDEQSLRWDIGWYVEQLFVPIEETRIELTCGEIVARDNPTQELDIVPNAEQGEVFECAFHSIDGG